MDSFFLQGLKSLRTTIVKLSSLAYLQGTRAEEEDF
jgi:hypothetical protein